MVCEKRSYGESRAADGFSGIVGSASVGDGCRWNKREREREREDTQGRARKDDKMLLDRFPGHIARPQVSQRTSVIVSTTYFLGNRRRGKVEREGMRLVRR